MANRNLGIEVIVRRSSVEAKPHTQMKYMGRLVMMAAGDGQEHRGVHDWPQPWTNEMVSTLTLSLAVSG